MIEDHIDLLRLILAGDPSRTQAYVRRMMGGVTDVLQRLRSEIDPAIFDVSLGSIKVTTGLAPPETKAVFPTRGPLVRVSAQRQR